MVWMRDAAKRLIRLTAFMSLDLLNDGQLDALMTEAVLAAAVSIRPQLPEVSAS
jgi:hypothetical protein